MEGGKPVKGLSVGVLAMIGFFGFDIASIAISLEKNYCLCAVCPS